MLSLIPLKHTLLALIIVLGTASNPLQQRARAESKNIAVYFCGSDWCANCHKFKKQVLADLQIDSLLQQQFVYYTADFPQRHRQADSVKACNAQLAERLNPDGVFPRLVIADEQLNIKAVIPAGAGIPETLQLLQHYRKP